MYKEQSAIQWIAQVSDWIMAQKGNDSNNYYSWASKSELYSELKKDFREATESTISYKVFKLVGPAWLICPYLSFSKAKSIRPT